MLLIRAIIRPEKTGIVLSELLAGGFPAVTKMDVYGRGKQKGITVGEIHYDELPKDMLLIIVNDEDKEDVVRIIMRNARSGGGARSAARFPQGFLFRWRRWCKGTGARFPRRRRPLPSRRR
jgi:nitrogen regulatory protein PII 1